MDKQIKKQMILETIAALSATLGALSASGETTVGKTISKKYSN
jgi:hypothetical protein